MPSFSNLSRQASFNDPSGADTLPAFHDNEHASGPVKLRMKHWSALPGPITDGFRRQREKQALQAQNQPSFSSPVLSHSSQTAPSISNLPTFSRSQVMHPDRLRRLAPPAFNHAFQDDHHRESGFQAFQQHTPALNNSRSFDPNTMEVIPVFPRYQVEDALGLPDNSYPEASLAIEDLVPAYPIRENSTRSLYGPRIGTPGLGSLPIPSINDVVPVPWLPVQPVNRPTSTTATFNALPPVDYETDNYADCRGRPEPSQKRAPRNYTQDRREPDSPPAPAKSRSRTRKNSNRVAAEDAPGPSTRAAPLKRRRSGTGLTRKRSKSFHEAYLDSVQKGGGKLPNDFDSFGFQDEDDEERWSTLDYFKKQKKTTTRAEEEDNAQAGEGDLPSTYKTFQPKFKPKADKQRMITTTNTFTLPIPAFNKLVNKPSGVHQASTSLGSTSTRKRALFVPPPLTDKREVKGRVIEILDDEEKQMKKKELLKGLSSSSTLGLVERIKPPSSDDAASSRTPGEYKSSLYKNSKLGDDMEATSSRPFSSLEHFGHEDDESWTSSPPRESGSLAVGDAGSAGLTADDTGCEAATNDGQPDGTTTTIPTTQSLQPLAKNWTFKKFFGR